jgi:hypothetical protein
MNRVMNHKQNLARPIKMTEKYHFSPASIDALLSRGSTLAIPQMNTRRITYTSRDFKEPLFKNIRGYLKEMSKDLGNIVNKLHDDGSNYRSILREWAIRFIQGLIEYRKVDIRLSKPDMATYETFFDKYSQVFMRAFVAEDVMADDNYENLEMIGDNEYRYALLNYIFYEMGVQNKSIATILKHTYEKTRSLSNLAAIFHMEPLIRSNGSKLANDLSEDVFESVMGAVHNLERNMLRDANSEHYQALAGDNRFCLRLVRMAFECSTTDCHMTVPPKTFIVGVTNLFVFGGAKIIIKEDSRDGLPIITLRATLPVIHGLCKIFGCDHMKLRKELNTTHCAKSSDINAKFFSEKVFESIYYSLEKLGISQQTVQVFKNKKHVPSSMHSRLMEISARADAKGFWLGINIPKNIKGRSTAVVQGMLYHSEHHRHIPQEEVAVKDSYMDPVLYATLFDKLDKLIARTPPIASKKTARSNDDTVIVEPECDIDNNSTGVSKTNAQQTSIRTKPGWTLGMINSTMFVGSKPIVPVAGTASNVGNASPQISPGPKVAGAINPGSVNPGSVNPGSVNHGSVNHGSVNSTYSASTSASTTITPVSNTGVVNPTIRDTMSKLETVFNVVARAAVGYTSVSTNDMMQHSGTPGAVNAILAYMKSKTVFRVIGPVYDSFYMLEIRAYKVYQKGNVPIEMLNFMKISNEFTLEPPIPGNISLEEIIPFISQMALCVVSPAGISPEMIAYMRTMKIIG